MVDEITKQGQPMPLAGILALALGPRLLVQLRSAPSRSAERRSGGSQSDARASAGWKSVICACEN
jgi:hypothetical protein